MSTSAASVLIPCHPGPTLQLACTGRRWMRRISSHPLSSGANSPTGSVNGCRIWSDSGSHPLSSGANSPTLIKHGGRHERWTRSSHPLSSGANSPTSHFMVLAAAWIPGSHPLSSGANSSNNPGRCRELPPDCGRFSSPVIRGQLSNLRQPHGVKLGQEWRSHPLSSGANSPTPSGVVAAPEREHVLIPCHPGPTLQRRALR